MTTDTSTNVYVSEKCARKKGVTTWIYLKNFI